MAKIFISHSSKDKEFVRKLATDLNNFGLQCWLDEWEIKVGDCIVNKIEEGITDSRFLLIVLSNNSVSSGWVDKEWKVKYWDEVNAKEVKVLPALIEKCEIPKLLQTKKYADFTTNYENGIKEILAALNGASNLIINQTTENNFSLYNDLLQKVVDIKKPLSITLAEGLSVAHRTNNKELSEFCKRQLSGDFNPNHDILNLKYRQINVYVSINHIKNVRTIGDFNINNFWNELSQAKDFHNTDFIMQDSVTRLESYINSFEGDINRTFITLPVFAIEIFPDYGDPNTQLYVYAKGHSYHQIYENIRQEFAALIMKYL